MQSVKRKQKRKKKKTDEDESHLKRKRDKAFDDDNEQEEEEITTKAGDEDTTKEWNSYIKTIKTPNARKRNTSSSVQENREGGGGGPSSPSQGISNTLDIEVGDSKQKKAPNGQKTRPTKKKKTDLFAKNREPCDLMQNDTRLNINEMMSKIASHHDQKALAVHVMPSRENQTFETLSLTNTSQYDHMLAASDMDICLEMKKYNFLRNKHAAAHPLEELVENGFLAVNNECMTEVLRYVSQDFTDDINYIKDSRKANSNKQQQLKLKSSNKGALTANGGGDTQDLSIKKLNMVFGKAFQSFGYNRRTSKEQSKRIKALGNSDRTKRFIDFFKNDQLYEEDGNKDFRELPINFKMFQTMRKENKEKYKRKDEITKNTASLTSKTDIEVIPMDYIQAYLVPQIIAPANTKDEITGVASGEVCGNGDSCVCKTFSPDKNVCYEMAPFYTPEEKKHLMEKRWRNPVKLNRRPLKLTVDEEEEFDSEDEEEEMIKNTNRLCYYCLTRQWTIQVAYNIRHEITPEKPMNHFVVLCEKDQYSKHCMLKMMENGKSTGIIGPVPRFSVNNKKIVALTKTVFENDKKHTLYRPYLAETGMDF